MFLNIVRRRRSPAIGGGEEIGVISSLRRKRLSENRVVKEGRKPLLGKIFSLPVARRGN